MSELWLPVFFYSTLAGMATFIGMWLILWRESWSRKNSATLVSYSAGVLLSVGILHLLPEAQGLTAYAEFSVLAAFIGFYFLEHHLFFHASHEELHHESLEIHGAHQECCENPHPLGTVAFVGMAMHSLIDGMIIGTGFEVDPHLGAVAAIGVICHEVPEGIAMLSILLHYGYQRSRAVAFTLIVALATPLGALATYAVIRELSTDLLGILLAFATGSFIYIAASDLIPESHRARGWKGTLALCAGILTGIAAGWASH